jgi:hypothetical protein
MTQAFNFRGSRYLALFVLGCTALFLLSQWFLAAHPHSELAGLADVVGFWSTLFGVVSIATMGSE